MSAFYDLASLVLVPSGYKTSKVYAQKPLTTDGQLAFTRSTTATRVGADGLIEKVRTNLALHSQTFDNAVYIKQNASIVANTTIAPDGTTTADTLDEGTLTTTHRLYQDFVVTANEEITLSVFFKKGTNDNVRIVLNDLSENFRWIGAQFNLTTLASSTAVGSFGGAVLINSSITDAGNGWYRLSITGNLNCTNLLGFVNASTATAITSSDDRGCISYAGTNKTLFLWGYQFEKGVATPYIPTTTAAVSVGMLANVPRLDYLGGGCPKLLLEPQRTNVLLRADTISVSNWGYVQSTLTGNVTGVDGFNSGRRITNGATANDPYVEQSITTSANTFTFSAFVKQGTAAQAWLYPVHVGMGGDVSYARFTFATKTFVNIGNIATSGYQEFANGWYRIFCSVVVTGAVSSLRMRFSNPQVANVYNDWAFPQVEIGSYPTSYIPTLGAVVTRSADAASKTGISALIGDSEGWIYGEVQGLTNAYGALSTILSVSDGTSSNRVQFSFNAATNVVTPRIFRAGSTIFVSDVVFNASNTFKFAIQYSGSTAVCFINGASVATTSGLTFFSAGTLSKVAFDDGTGSTLGHAKVSQVLIGQTALTNAQLAELTA